MGPASILPGTTLAALAIPLLLTSCATSDGNVFAHPAPTTTASTAATAPGAGTSAAIMPLSMLRAFVGADADRLRREVGAAGAMQMTDHFVFVAAPQSRDLPRIAGLLEHTHRAFFETFGGAGTRLAPIRSPLVWMVFDDRPEYEAYAQAADGMDMSWSKAYYSAQTNRVAIAIRNEGLQPVDPAAPPATTSTTGAENQPKVQDDKLSAQITHEAGHQLAFNSGLQTRGVMYPLWASEGLAANFELDARGRLGPQSGNELRARHLAVAIADQRIMPLEQWVACARVPVGRPAQVNAVYSQAWAFFRFLHEKHRDQLLEYLAHMATQQPGRRSEEALKKDFVRVFGDPQALTAPWNDFLEQLARSAGQ
jgi:hypothetical protein